MLLASGKLNEIKSNKERKKSLTRGHVKGIGSTMGIRSYRGQG
jgi:hypothetical protein